MKTSSHPYIICHMMSTLDGKITSGIKDVDIFTDFFYLYTETENQLEAKAWMCGRVTMEMFASGVGTPLPTLNKKVEETDFIVPNNQASFMVAVDTKGLLRWDKNTIVLEGVSGEENLIVVVTGATPKEYLAYLQDKGISYIFGGKDEVDFKLIFQKLKDKFQIDKLLLEGGGLLNGSVLAADYVDEISLLIVPIVLNKSNIHTIFESSEKSLNIKQYRLSEVKKLEKDTVWLRYKKVEVKL